MRRWATVILVLFALPAWAATEKVLIDGRHYLIDLPAQSASRSLIVVLHGGGGNPRQVARNTGFSRPATAAGHAVIYPAGTGRRLLTWNGGYCCGPAARQGVDDIAFLDQVIADARQRFGLHGKVYITGMSNGALMAEAYAAARPRAIAAVAGVSGTVDLGRHPPRGPVPLLHLHGTADTQVPYAGGRGSEGFTDTDFTPVADVIAAFVRVNGGAGGGAGGRGLVQSSRIIDPADDGMRTVETTWARGGRPIVRLLRIEGGGHVWPGGRRAGRQGGDTRDIAANAEILRFFAAHP